jgi:serine/threonine protein kinase/tetratricopeptide (TPR) repeat protein
MMDQIISHFEIIEEIGRGGMGVVYKARDTKLDRLVALKFLPHELIWNTAIKNRFIREARAASALDHPNICTIYEINESEQGQMFIAMAYYDAETLKQKLEKGSLSVQEAVDITLQICRGLKKAHQKGLIHRDIKPANILITRDGIVKIVDFGLAKLEGQTRITKDSSTMGTVAYLSPEQASGEEVDARTDIWAVGAMLYEMLAGQLPFKGDVDQVLIYSILHEDPVPLASKCHVPEEIELVVEKALQKEADHRYQHIADLENDLSPILGAESSIDELDRLRKSSRKATPKKRFWIPVLVILGLILVFLVSKRFILKNASIKEPIPIAVISFQNQTGDAAYDYLQDAIPNLLITSLEQSPALRVTTWERLYDLLRQINKADTKVINRDIGFELCRLDGIEAIVLGSYIKAGNTFATDVKVLDVSDKRLIRSAQAKGEGVASILRNQIDELSREISKGVGLSEQTFRETHMKLAEVTTSSMEAYRNFILGRDCMERSYWEDALPFFKKAIELDSTFCMAYLNLARTYVMLFHAAESNLAFYQAKKYSHKATEKERLYIEETMSYFDSNKRYHILKEMVKKYPKEKRVYYRLGCYYFENRMLDEAINAFESSLKLDPEYGPALGYLGATYMAAEDFDKALKIKKSYAKKSPNDAEPVVSMGDLYFRMGQLKDAVQEYERAIQFNPKFYQTYLKISYCYALMEKYDVALQWIDRYTKVGRLYGSEGEAIWWTAFYQIWLGRFDLSQNSIEAMIDLARKYNTSYGVAMGEFLMGRVHYEHPDGDTGQSYFTNAFEEFSRNEPMYYIQFHTFYKGIVDLKKGEMDSAEFKLIEMKALMPEVKKKHPWLKEPVAYCYYTLQAEVLLAKNKVQDAIAIAAKANPDFVPYIPSMLFVFYNIPPHHDVLARAYQQAGNLDKAIAEYEQLTRFHPESKDRRLIYPKYHYYLAKLYQETDQTENAIEQFQKFLEIWKHADPDSPELIDAKNNMILLTEK